MGKTRKIAKGGVTFNVKPNSNLNFNYNLPNSYLNDMRARIPQPANEHANNAEIMGALQTIYNDPENMKRALQIIYDPQPLTYVEQNTANQLKMRGKKGINILSRAHVTPRNKARVLNKLRYNRQLRKIAHMYEIDHRPKFLHPEWNVKN